MKKIYWIIITNLLFFHFSQGQAVTIANEKMNILFNCVDNPIAITAENVPCSLLIVKTTNGIINGKNCSYTCKPATTGSADIMVYKKQKGKLVEIKRSSFKVKRFPGRLVFKIGSGKRLITANEINAGDSVRVELDDIDLDMTFPVEQFTVRVSSKDSSVKMEKINTGNKLDGAIKEVFRKLQPGDVVVFKDIFIRLCSEEHVQIDSREFVIKE